MHGRKADLFRPVKKRALPKSFEILLDQTSSVNHDSRMFIGFKALMSIIKIGHLVRPC